MAPIRFVLLMLGSLLLAGAAISAMPELALSDVNVPLHMARGEGDGGQALLAWFADSKGENDGNVHVLHKFYVPPPYYMQFVDAWLDAHKCTKEEAGVKVHDLKKTKTDNVIFMEYGIWESKSAFMEHLKSKHMAKFADQVMAMDVVVTIKPMRTLYSPEEGKMGESSDGWAAWLESGSHEKRAYVIGDWIVPPSKAEGFLQAFTKAANATIEEKHNRNFALDKSMTDNIHYYSYGTWDTMSDWAEHLEKEYVSDLMAYVQDHGIVFFLAPLYKFGDQPEA